MSNPQKLLKDLYEDLDKEEKLLSEYLRYESVNSPQMTAYFQLFAELYQVPGETSPGETRVRLVGPVGERPLHVCLLRADTFDEEMRAGLIDGVK